MSDTRVGIILTGGLLFCYPHNTLLRGTLPLPESLSALRKFSTPPTHNFILIGFTLPSATYTSSVAQPFSPTQYHRNIEILSTLSTNLNIGIALSHPAGHFSSTIANSSDH
ncbi:hypothetical protein WAI453_004331 [Rhynchosporium graminicola]